MMKDMFGINCTGTTFGITRTGATLGITRTGLHPVLAYYALSGL